MEPDKHKPLETNENAAIVRWLAPLDRDAAPLDPSVVDRVNRLAGDTFAAGSEVRPEASAYGSQKHDPKRRRRHMFTKAAAVLVAAACSVALLFFQPADLSVGAETLGAVLKQTLDAESLQLKIKREGDSAEVLVEPAGRIRWQESLTSYRIASGSKLWRIDEKANTVIEGASPWYDETQGQVDLLALLGIDSIQAARFRETRGENVTIAGQRCHRFRLETTSAGEPLVIEAIADGKTGLLRTIAAWPPGPRRGPPLAELTLVARDVPIDEDKFVVAKSLLETGRVGKVVDAQGIVSLRPMMSDRWTPVCRQLLVKPGDWLRTDVRGANAAALTLTSHRKLTAGPGSLLELNGPNRVKLHSGEIKIAGSKQSEDAFELSGPGGEPVSIPADQTAHYRVDREGNLQQLAKPPLWLRGFEGTTADDSIGSLIVNVDGRDVPLTVGDHKVSVEIRDQIARTTIEESFVNRTNGRLEGIFHFPLPQDASISGFGMWINGELIEAAACKWARFIPTCCPTWRRGHSIDRHNLALYKDLAQQLKADEALAERAATTLVEAAPNEAEHHQALAEYRQDEGRWDDAIKHWKHVAELRRLEPTGLLKLAEAQIHQEQFDEAQRTIDKLNRTEWPARFAYVRSQIDRLQQKIAVAK